MSNYLPTPRGGWTKYPERMWVQTEQGWYSRPKTAEERREERQTYLRALAPQAVEVQAQ